ncbi:hypothetical protein DCAR_0728805 [Daucus carota subsp. sativus]|uniref:Uncharacterized protein n=2 Tax=Daucus carota subsp. sativus TaxID=79200 RepID=A0AAF0XJR9_DAUCS|nr:hypothetical protein DCAR_0728805 [Daucus carota subsp. sativus]
MDSEDKGMGVTEGSSKETKKRGRPKKNADPPKKHSVSREKNADPPIIHSVSPSLIAESPPPGFPSKFLVWPVKNRTSLATGSVSAGVSQSKAVHGAVSETLGSGRTPKLECNTNMKTEEAQRQMHQFTSTVTELCTGFETLKKENKELRKQVTDLEGQNQKWKDQEASWDVKKKELERECDEARKEALAAVGKKHKGMGVTDGSWREKRKRGRPRKYGLDVPIIHSVSPLPIAESPPPGFPSKFLVLPVKNRTSLATGSVSAGGSQSKALHGAKSETLASGAKHKLAIKCPEPKYKLINMENEEFTGRQAQMQLHQFASTFSELNNGFESAKKKIKELGKQVPDLTIQIQKWNDEKASWDLKMKELERERDEAREEALKAVGEKRDLEKKLEKAAKEAEDAKASAKRAIDERRDLKCSLFSSYSERMLTDKDPLPSSWLKISSQKANEGATSLDNQSNAGTAVKRKQEAYVSTDDEDDQPLSFRRARTSMAAKPAARHASSLAAGTLATKSGVTGFENGEKRKLLNNRPMVKFKINVETEGTIASQAQRQIRQAASTVSELCTGFETSKMKNEELRKQVIDLQGQIRKWKGQKARWDEMKKELERERDDVRKEVHKAASEKRDLEEKLEKTVKKAEDEKVYAKRAIEEAALKAFSEKRHLEEKLGMAVKQAEDFKAAAKKAIYEAASTKKCYKIGLSNFVAYLATGEGRSLGDYVNELIEEIPHDNRAPGDAAINMAGLKGDRTIKDEPRDYHLAGFAENAALQGNYS